MQRQNEFNLAGADHRQARLAWAKRRREQLRPLLRQTGKLSGPAQWQAEPATNQTPLTFEKSGEEAGHSAWLAERRQQLKLLSRKLGLPINHTVELWLQGGIRLRGQLMLEQEQLFWENKRDFSLKLRIDKTTFTPAEIEACVRLDD